MPIARFNFANATPSAVCALTNSSCISFANTSARSTSLRMALPRCRKFFASPSADCARRTDSSATSAVAWALSTSKIRAGHVECHRLLAADILQSGDLLGNERLTVFRAAAAEIPQRPLGPQFRDVEFLGRAAEGHVADRRGKRREHETGRTRVADHVPISKIQLRQKIGVGDVFARPRDFQTLACRLDRWIHPIRQIDRRGEGEFFSRRGIQGNSLADFFRRLRRDIVIAHRRRIERLPLTRWFD